MCAVLVNPYIICVGTRVRGGCRCVAPAVFGWGDGNLEPCSFSSRIHKMDHLRITVRSTTGRIWNFGKGLTVYDCPVVKVG